MRLAKIICMLLVMLLAGASNADAKKKPKTTLDILTSVPTWVHHCPTHSKEKGGGVFFSFNENTGKCIVYDDGLRFTNVEFAYRLSNGKDKKCNEKKGGRAKNGRYIIGQVTKYREIDVLIGRMKDKNGNPIKSPTLFRFEIVKAKPDRIVIRDDKDSHQALGYRVRKQGDEFIPLQGSFEEVQIILKKNGREELNSILENAISWEPATTVPAGTRKKQKQ